MDFAFHVVDAVISSDIGGSSGQSREAFLKSILTPGEPNLLGAAMNIIEETCHEEDFVPYMLYKIQARLGLSVASEEKYKEEFTVVKGYADFVNLHRVLAAKKAITGNA
jgi:hypothetical protein